MILKEESLVEHKLMELRRLHQDMGNFKASGAVLWH